MTRYAALLRGIMPANPNMRNEKLRGVFEGLGLTEVASVLASGNIIFNGAETDVPALERRIQRALTAELGIPGGTTIRTHAQLRGLLDSDPFPGLTHGRGSYLTATFLQDGSAAPVGLPDQPDPLTTVVGYDEAARVLLAVIDNSRPGASPGFMSWLERTYGTSITTRTWLTVQRIVRRLEA